MFKRIISLALSVVFSLQTCGFAQVVQLNLTGYLGHAGSVSALDRFRPASLRYFSYEPKTDDFRILLDKADEKDLSDIQVKDKADELMKYFRIGLSLPNDKFWVNLRPDAPEQIIDPALEQTDIGKIMLAADLQLKKDTASWTSPRTKEGKEYWNKLYQKAGELFGSENITIPTITRPWIVPGEIIVRESGDSAYIYKAALKVMLEEDYLTSRGGSRTAPTYQQYAFSDPRLKELNQYSTQLIRELIIPKLTKEVNRAKRYAGLRQVYYSLILARWFKQSHQVAKSPGHQGNGMSASRENTLIKLIDSGNLDNLASQEPWSKDTYYQGYKKSFEQGEYNLSETVHTPTGQVIRRYMSGGTLFGNQIRIEQYSNMVDLLIAPKGAYVITGNGLTDQTAISAGSALEEKEILNAKTAELEGIIKRVFERSKKIEGLQKAVWIGRSEAAGGLSEVKKVCDEIIKWIDNNEPEIDKEPLRVFSDSLKVIAIIGELKSLALLLEVSPSIINKALEKMEIVQDESQRREILKELVNQLEAIMPAAEERLEKISASLNKSGSPLSEKMRNLLTELNQYIKVFSDNFDSLPKSNQDLAILNAQVGVIQKMIEEIRNELWYFLSPEVFLADESIEIGINFELIHDAFDRKLQEALKEGQKFSDSYQFILETKISIAGITYDSFMVYRALDGYKISFRYSDGNRDDITLYVDRDIEKTSVTVGNKAIKEELIRQIGQGSNLQYIAEPIKKALVSSAVTAAQTTKAGSALDLRLSLIKEARQKLSSYLPDKIRKESVLKINDSFSLAVLQGVFDKIIKDLIADYKNYKPGEIKGFAIGILEEFSKILFLAKELEEIAEISRKLEKETVSFVTIETDKKELQRLSGQLAKKIEGLKQYIAASSSLLTKADVVRIINDFIGALKNQVIPNEDFLERIVKANSNEEIKMLFQRLIFINDNFMDSWKDLQKRFLESSGADRLSPLQFDEKFKSVFKITGFGEVLVIGSKDDPNLTNMVEGIRESYAEFSEKQPDAFKAPFGLGWKDGIKGFERQIASADMIVTRSYIAADIVKQFEFNVILSDGNRMILRKIPSSIPGQEARGEDSSLTAVEAVKLAKEAIWGKETAPGQIVFPTHKSPIDAVKSMFKSILRDKNHTSEPVSYLSDFKKIVDQCSGEVYGSNFASLFYFIKLGLDDYQRFTEDALDLSSLQDIINSKFLHYLKYFQKNIPELRSKPSVNLLKDLSEIIKFINEKDRIIFKFPYKTEINKSELLACLEFIKEVTASSAITKQVGGIDFRQMNMLIQPMGSFSGLNFSPIALSSSALESLDLDKELESITRMASGSMLPSPQRLKEYISACIFKGKIGEKGDEFVLSMLEVFQLQAEEGIESSAEEREAVVMADTRSYVLAGAP